MDPKLLSKYLYIERTPTWFIRTINIVGMLVWIPVVVAAVHATQDRPLFAWLTLPIVLMLTVHYYSSYILNLFYRRFDLDRHFRLLDDYWKKNSEPSVDIFLPICGEEMDVLSHVWQCVSDLSYTNREVYVLDDSKEHCQEHRTLAESYGFHYIERPEKGKMKKAGNLKYGFERSTGEYIAIFDADFAPHPDYLHELIPYMSEERVGIVQTPQYFPETKDVHDAQPLAYGGARSQEAFYRVIQVARDQLDGAHCCGTCAIYRRTSLTAIGGFVQIGHSEDAYTGYALTASGWIVRYVPIILSIGLSPEDPHAFFHQQHRWCLGNIMMMVSADFWTAPVPWRIKFCYVTGFLFYLNQPLLLLFSFQLFIVLFFYGNTFSFQAGLPFYPYVIWTVSFMVFFELTPLRWGYLYAILFRMYAYCHAVMTELLGGTVGWIPTNSKHAGVSSAFQQTVIGASIYSLLYFLCLILVVRVEGRKLFLGRYYLSEFWLVFNLVISVAVLWKLYATLIQARKKQAEEGIVFRDTYTTWQFKTAGTYSGVAVCAALAIILFPTLTTATYQRHFEQVSLFEVASAMNIAPDGEWSRMVVAPSTLAFDRYSGDQNEDIKVLQKFLNARGLIVSYAGAGSVGQETSYFGTHTLAALNLFQKSLGLPQTGNLDQDTRRIINALIMSDLMAY